ncbi:MAG: electron transfer flavoprotein subunit beta/FixA family protein, partial [Chloroflexi bacterium]|nr:electron transfer flavoprotein subunit beta/FixA family protein [Chloroflexota bacterium]
MALRIAVCVKQVPDPDAPASTFKIDEVAKRVVPPTGIPPVVNGFDLHATE